jgi:hypothetical protein
LRLNLGGGLQPLDRLELLLAGLPVLDQPLLDQPGADAACAKPLGKQDFLQLHGRIIVTRGKPQALIGPDPQAAASPCRPSTHADGRGNR